jgi:hypothetical protein
VLFALAFFGVSNAATVAAGAFWGLVVWIGMSYVLLPILGLKELTSAAPVPMAVFNHVMFGLGVGIGFLRYQRNRTLRAWHGR